MTHMYPPDFLDALGYALECLRILAGPVCERCLDVDGELVPAVECTDRWNGSKVRLCDTCYDRNPWDGDDRFGREAGDFCE